ncbi:MAG: phosphoribosylglycinamide formyltransferase [Mycoplasmataceae bacterium]|nr:phosphoribosylglycinamide formyltransferase [Mycoplasmataceae bacterium]
MFKIAVLVSGDGSNLQAIIDQIHCQSKVAKIALVISSASNAYALQRAQQYHIPTRVVSRTTCNNPSDQILKLCQQAKIDLIVLAGYLSILTGQLLSLYAHKIINIHPSLLPDFGGYGMYGMHVHEAVIKARAKFSGCTVHFVSDGVDQGAIIAQVKIPVLATDTPHTLAQRVLVQEHELLPKVIQQIIDGVTKK